MAIPLTQYVHFDTATLTTMRTEALAEMSRLMVAGQNFGMPGGRTRGGIQFSDLSAHLAALNYAIKQAGGQVIEVTVADCSQEL